MRLPNRPRDAKALTLNARTIAQIERVFRGRCADVTAAVQEVTEHARHFLRWNDAEDDKADGDLRRGKGRPARIPYLRHAKALGEMEVLAVALAERGDLSKDDALGVHRFRLFCEARAEEQRGMRRVRDELLALSIGRRTRAGLQPWLAAFLAATFARHTGERPTSTPDSPYSRLVATVFRALGVGPASSEQTRVARAGIRRWEQTIAHDEWRKLGEILTPAQRRQRRRAGARSGRIRGSLGFN